MQQQGFLLPSKRLTLQATCEPTCDHAFTGSSCCCVLLQAAKTVSEGYHRNLSTALADLYQTHIGSFLAGMIYQLCGNKLDLITLMHAHQEWTTSRPADNTLLQALVCFCETRTVAELPALMNQVNVVSVVGHIDYTAFRPAHEFPLFPQVNAAMNNIKVSSLWPPLQHLAVVKMCEVCTQCC